MYTTSDNLQYNTLVCWADGTNNSSTKRLIFQVFLYCRLTDLLPVSGLVDSATAMNQKDKNLEKSIFVHFNMTFLTTLTGI